MVAPEMVLVRYTNAECFPTLKIQVCPLKAFDKLTLKGLFPTQRHKFVTHSYKKLICSTYGKNVLFCTILFC